MYLPCGLATHLPHDILEAIIAKSDSTPKFPAEVLPIVRSLATNRVSGWLPLPAVEFEIFPLLYAAIHFYDLDDSAVVQLELLSLLFSDLP